MAAVEEEALRRRLELLQVRAVEEEALCRWLELMQVLHRMRRRLPILS